MNPRPTNLRQMTDADVPMVLRLEHELFPEDAWSEGMLRGELDDQPRTRHYVVAENSPGEVIGYAGLAAAGGQGDIQTIGVRPDHQGHGIGAALLAELLAEAKRRSCAEVFLEVRADNDRAKALYERFGFAAVGVRRRYYQPSGTDAVVMRRGPHRAPFGFGTDAGPRSNGGHGSERQGTSPSAQDTSDRRNSTQDTSGQHTSHQWDGAQESRDRWSGVQDTGGQDTGGRWSGVQDTDGQGDGGRWNGGRGRPRRVTGYDDIAPRADEEER